MKRLFMPLVLLVVSALPVQAQDQRPVADKPTTLDSVITSALEHFPMILAAKADIEVRQGELLATNGAFDPRLEGSLNDRLQGYYSGDSLDGGFVQELPFMNSRIFGGYRLSSGDFPQYSLGSLTRDEGEYRLGFSLSLLRDRDIDADRAARQSASLALLAESRGLSLQQLNLLQDVYVAYVRWLVSWKLRDAYQELLSISLERGEAIAMSIAEGNSAEILQVENNQAVLQRRALVTEADRQISMQAERLALYLRDEAGNMLIPVYDAALSLPAEDGELLARPVDSLLQEIFERRPEIAQARLKREQSEIKLALAENLGKPRLDFKLYNSRDFGSGLQSLAGNETVADLSFSIPLRTREARGKARAAEAEISAQGHRIRLLMDQLEVEVRQSRVNLEATRQLEELAMAELDAAEQLAAAERARFQAGLSDFFLLNIRERQIAEAQLKRWQAFLQHQTALADYYGATMRLPGLDGLSGAQQ
jgi:outer membrane protein TolC